MDSKDLAGRQMIPGSRAAIRVGLKGEFSLDPIHASWRFHALRENLRHEHSHGVFHFLLVTEGSGSFMLDGEQISIVAPMLLLVSPEMPHVFSTAMDEALVYHEFTFTLEGHGSPKTWIELLDHCYPGLNCHAGMSIDRNPGIAIHPGNELANRIDTSVLGLTATLAGRTHYAFLDAYVRMLFTLAAEALLEGQDTGSALCRDGKDAGADPLAVVMSYLEQHAIEHFPLALLAGMAGLSEKHLCRSFRTRYGMTIFQIKRDKILERAERLLVSTRYPLKQIAQMTGFLDEYHFSKAFRRHFGQPPGKYRAGSGYNQSKTQ
jgi:AraC-like DNA-binding protein/mannose-6-phosphate isomerase-like protein (cupin superfamily)